MATPFGDVLRGNGWAYSARPAGGVLRADERAALSRGSGARLPCASTGRNNDLDRSAHPGLAVDLHLPAQHGGALAHPDQAKGPAHALIDAGEALAVVIDVERNLPGGIAIERHDDFGRLGVARDVGQRLLDHPVERRGEPP